MSNGEVSLREILRENGEEHLYDQILELAEHAEEFLPLIIGWKFVDEFVQAIKTANHEAASGGEAVPEPPFPIPEPLTSQSFKKALVKYARAGSDYPLGTTCLPCNPIALGANSLLLGLLNFDPWTQRIIEAAGGVEKVMPVAYVYEPKPYTGTLQPVAYFMDGLFMC